METHEVEYVSSEDSLRHNLTVFLPYILLCVDAKDILTHMTCFSKVQRKSIFEASLKNNHKAAQLAVEVILTKEEAGLFTDFREAMEQAGYPKIVKMLDGKNVEDDEHFGKILDLLTKDLVTLVQPRELLPYLLQSGVLQQEESEEVRAEEINHGITKACWMLFFHLPRRTEDWFTLFMKALIQTHQYDAAELLEPDLYEKLKAQADFKQQEEQSVHACEPDREDNHLDQESDDTDKFHNSGGPPRYTRKFLLDCRKSPLSLVPPEGLEKMTDVWLPPPTQKRNVATRQVAADARTVAKRPSPSDDSLSSDDNTVAKQPFCADGSNVVKHLISPENKTVVNQPLLSEETYVKQSFLQESTKVMNQPFLPNDNTVADHPSSSADGGILVCESTMEHHQSVEGAACSLDLKGAPDELNISQSDEMRNITVGEEDKVLNTATDADVVEGNDEDLFPKLRGYQIELAKEGAEGENTIVIAPTNTGKTWVACYIMQEHLRRCHHSGRIGKIVFIVENEALAIQQGNLCTQNLPAHRTKVITGSMQRDKGQYLRDFVNRRDILVVTAMVLVNCLKSREIQDLTTFSLLLFDECHHSNDNHPYNQVLSKYRRLKLQQNMDAAQLPQVVGLTASLGVGGHTNDNGAIRHMKQIMANMDAKLLSTVRSRHGLEEMKGYENPPLEEIVTATPRQNDTFRENVLTTMDAIDAAIKTDPSIRNLRGKDSEKRGAFYMPDSQGSEQFIQWLSDFKKAMVEVTSIEARNFLDTCRQHLEVYNKALMIHQDARVVDALKILKDFMLDAQERLNRPSVTDIEEQLIALYTEVAAADYGEVSDNPKLVKMQELVLTKCSEGEDSRGIMFVRTKELATALVSWMNENEALKHLNTVKFVGQNASAGSGGMTRSGQADALQYFRDGKHKMIVATSVAEEGLDITKCNLVIRYEHVTNEIVRLQSKGRARAPDSKYYVLTAEGSWIIIKEEKNAMLERLMKKVVPVLQRNIADNINQWEDELRQMQLDLLHAELLAEQRRDAARTDEQMELHCLHCSTYICMSDEIRRIQDAHHVVIGDDVKDRVVTERQPIPQYAEDDLTFDGDVFCKECHSSLGGVCTYKNVEFPLLAIKHFRVEDRNGKGYTQKKWKQVKFRVINFTLNDLEQIYRQRVLEQY